MQSRWILACEDASLYHEIPPCYVGEGGKVCFNSAKAKQFESQAAAIAQAPLWKLGTHWQPVFRTLPDSQIK